MKAKAFLVCALLTATTAWALTVTKTETRIDGFQILLVKQPGDPLFLVSYRTYDDQEPIRVISGEDYWSSLTPAQKTQVRAVVDGAYQKAHQVNDIPMPTQTPVATATPGAMAEERPAA